MEPVLMAGFFFWIDSPAGVFWSGGADVRGWFGVARGALALLFIVHAAEAGGTPRTPENPVS